MKIPLPIYFLEPIPEKPTSISDDRSSIPSILSLAPCYVNVSDREKKLNEN